MSKQLTPVGEAIRTAHLSKNHLERAASMLAHRKVRKVVQWRTAAGVRIITLRGDKLI